VDLLLDLARVYELGGKKDAAVETYRKVLKEVPETPRADEARARLARLGATP
jgi:TolA-binding protein